MPGIIPRRLGLLLMLQIGAVLGANRTDQDENPTNSRHEEVLNIFPVNRAYRSGYTNSRALFSREDLLIVGLLAGSVAYIMWLASREQL